MSFTLLLVLALPAQPAPGEAAKVVRFATFNASLNRESEGELAADLATGDDPQARNVAEIIQRVRPAVLLINEFDFDPVGQSIDRFRTNYLRVSQNGCEPIDFPYAFSAQVNTGVSSGFDLDNDGQAGGEPGSRAYGNDALGYGVFRGQYGMVVLSQFPIDKDAVRQLGKILWKDMPDALLPVDSEGRPWYSIEELANLPVSSKSHWDVPIKIGGKLVHLLVSHPTPPAFDGPEDRNGKRNHDEIRLWADYLTGGTASNYLGASLAEDEPFLVMGDLNADPLDGGSVPGAIQQLLHHPRIQGKDAPESAGALTASHEQAGANVRHRSPAQNDTADFSDGAVGNLRADYVLPSKNLEVAGRGVFWPLATDPLARLVWGFPLPSSDHRLVYVDIQWTATP